MQFALTIGLCAWGGYWLDGRRYLPAPLGTIVGFLAGFGIGLYQLARSVK